MYGPPHRFGHRPLLRVRLLSGGQAKAEVNAVRLLGVEHDGQEERKRDAVGGSSAPDFNEERKSLRILR